MDKAFDAYLSRTLKKPLLGQQPAAMVRRKLLKNALRWKGLRRDHGPLLFWSSVAPLTFSWLAASGDWSQKLSDVVLIYSLETGVMRSRLAC